MEDIGKAAERATLVAGGLEEDAKAAREIATQKAHDNLNADLFNASSACKIDTVKELLGKGADASWRNGPEQDQTSLHAACASTISITVKDKQSVLDVCNALIEAGADVNGRDSEDNTPLYLACGCGTSPIVVDMLLEKGADPNAVCGEKMSTSLIRASAFGHKEMVESLIAKGAALEAR